MNHQQSPRRLIDSFGRLHNNLRISVTDRCNIRCFYCMPADIVEFMPKAHLLTFEEIERIVRVGTTLGIDRIRLTGGEPLVRRDLHILVQRLAEIPGIIDIGLTTNGILLDEQAQLLRDAGLKRLNISLDALDPEVFKAVTRRDGYERVLAGIEAARKAGFSPIKLNAVSVRGLTEDQIVPFGHMARESETVVRFIEFMPLDSDGQWQRDKVLFAHEIIAILESEFGPLRPVLSKTDGVNANNPLAIIGNATTHAPAQDYEFADGRGRIGLIASVSQPFCASCNRFRVTADGKFRNCLFSHEETDVKTMLRSGGTDHEIAELMLECIAAKNEGHEINSAKFIQPDRPMHSIGG
ncbi:MAG: GTP 3',8-cyclase MoaA [Fuerstia sp.]|nr:GTP 3',8-cyclase MoaA [Fuerstiella sp.]